LGDNDAKFIDRVFAKGIDPYVRRLKGYSFERKPRVLDAACGFGQWALGLAHLNAAVDAFDMSSSRVDFLGELGRSLGLGNLSVQQGSLESHPFLGRKYELIFCYGALYCSDWKVSLKSLSECLAPGGQLYLNANGMGWYIHLWRSNHNKANDYDPREVAAQAFSDTVEYSRGALKRYPAQIIVEPDEMRAELERLGFSGVRHAGEGCLAVDGGPSFFPGSFGEFCGVYEVIADKY
jgi:SAM-dependent methyltransferase